MPRHLHCGRGEVAAHVVRMAHSTTSSRASRGELRILMNRPTRTNITLDFAWGAGLSGIYFGAREVF